MAVVVVSHNSERDLAGCLEALLDDRPDRRIVVVDNASKDDSVDVARRVGGDRVEVEALETNTGFAGGCNRGYDLVREEAEFVAFMNPDVRVEPACLDRCVAVMEEDASIGCVAPLLVRRDGETVDSAGQRLKRWTLEVDDRGYGRAPDIDASAPGQVLASCGALAVFRREALESVREAYGPWVQHFFCFWEDLEIGWRLTNAGWKVWFEPRARAEHGRGAGAGGGSGPLRWRRSPALEACILSNRWMTLARHLHGLDLLTHAPVLFVWDIALVVVGVVRRPTLALHLFRRVPLVWRELRRRRRRPRKRLSDLPC